MLAFAACSGDDDSPVMADEQPIGFTVENVADTRGVLVDQELFDQAGSEFLVFADYRYNEDAASPTGYRDSITVFRGQAVTSDGTKWTYSPLQFWHKNGAYDFRAVWPSTADALENSTGQALAVTYSLFKDDYDLMVAYKHRDMAKYASEGSVVGLEFRHALSAVNVMIKKSSADAQPYTLKNVYFKNLYSVGILPFIHNPETGEELSALWRLTYIDNAARLHETAFDTQLTAEGTATPYMFMLPQDVNGSGYDTENPAMLCFVLDVNGQEVTSEVILPPYGTTGYTRWVAGTVYTYEVTVKASGVDLSVVTTQWDEIEATADDIRGAE